MWSTEITPGFVLKGDVWQGVHYVGWKIHPMLGKQGQPPRGQRWGITFGDQPLSEISENHIFTHLDDAKFFISHDNWPAEEFAVGDHVYYTMRGEPIYQGRVFEVSSYMCDRYSRGLYNEAVPIVTIFVGNKKHHKPFVHIMANALRKGPKQWPLLMLPKKVGF